MYKFIKISLSVFLALTLLTNSVFAKKIFIAFDSENDSAVILLLKSIEQEPDFVNVETYDLSNIELFFEKVLKPVVTIMNEVSSLSSTQYSVNSLKPNLGTNFVSKKPLKDQSHDVNEDF